VSCEPDELLVIAKLQASHHLAEDPTAGFGDRLLVAEVRRDAMTIRAMGAPATVQ